MFDTFYTSTLNFIHSTRHHVIKKSISFGLHSTRQMSINTVDRHVDYCVDIVWTCLNILCPGWVSKRPLDYQARAVTNELPRRVPVSVLVSPMYYLQQQFPNWGAVKVKALKILFFIVFQTF
uniref:Uncharacterized protein n=1 Tax=Cacopsylla melanoneura TaxID=428564 RepID=A0A8D8WAW9_9HEMI